MNKILSNFKIYNPLVISKDTIEWFCISLLFLFSFVNTTTLFISMLLLIILLKQKEIGAIKILNLITMRTIINPAFAVGIGIFQNLKWALIFYCSIYLILGYRKMNKLKRKKLDKIMLYILIFTVYSAFSSFVFSTLPIVAIFKLLSYSTVFCGVIIGVANTIYKIDWINWMYKMMRILFISSVPIIFHPNGYLINGHAFQGILNQPNMFGILAALYISLILTKKQLETYTNNITFFLEIVCVIYMITLSESRTGFLTTVLILFITVYFSNINKINKIFLVMFLSSISVIFILSENKVYQFIQSFLNKGNQGVFYSRTKQLSGLTSNFLRNPWFGSGFSVPVTQYRSFIFNSEFIVEPGNLIIAVLSYGGIFGFILFMNYMVKIILTNKVNLKKLILLVISSIVICMGEMVFFSTNNIGIWLYMFFGIYISQNTEKILVTKE